MESLTYMKQLRVSSKTLRFVMPHVKRMPPQKALEHLMYSPKKEARFLYKAIHSAIHNAVQTLKVGPDMLQFKLFTVEQGRPLKRYRPGARGGVRPVKKKFSHIKIVMAALPEAIQKPLQKKKIEKPLTEKKTITKRTTVKRTAKKQTAKVKESISEVEKNNLLTNYT